MFYSDVQPCLESYLQRVRNLESRNKELESQAKRTYVSLKTELDKEMKAKESICKKRDKLEAKAAEDREQIQKLDDEVKSKNMFLKDLEACLNDVTERNDEISRSLERQHTVLREKLKRWKTQLQGRMYQFI